MEDPVSLSSHPHHESAPSEEVETFEALRVIWDSAAEFLEISRSQSSGVPGFSPLGTLARWLSSFCPHSLVSLVAACLFMADCTGVSTLSAVRRSCAIFRSAARSCCTKFSNALIAFFFCTKLSKIIKTQVYILYLAAFIQQRQRCVAQLLRMSASVATIF